MEARGARGRGGGGAGTCAHAPAKTPPRRRAGASGRRRNDTGIGTVPMNPHCVKRMVANSVAFLSPRHHRRDGMYYFCPVAVKSEGQLRYFPDGYVLYERPFVPK